ncbi:VacB/RNase II family 3'-5' exoribonuclease [Marinimicrobium sp. ABcell2]|uniref:VacB/RNase II family 3'-5' exoribonuclease n=1 Tax=Marinimicrobium sp. ABcell2 TaxID=3069751 RepID=UPI0027AE18F5|nr:VacB/RNase II family 3'-5' exoribonuclease [Marinimicrobium sp. ABcell2]MDQ2077164.1 VacB/RNase II family 3'-5' exoribonuclease [Marinimicrobium sp. ABcell2]
MFDKNALQQLTALKSSLQSQKNLSQGLVRTTTKRFAFVRLDDGKDAFLAPDEAQKVLPGDRVEVSLTTNKKDQLEATLEKLLDSEFSRFVGRYRVRGKAHFIEPDFPQFNRWLFVAPQDRGEYRHGDYVQGKLTRHPFKNDGKGQVKPTAPLGSPGEPGVEARYLTAKFELPTEWSVRAQEQAQAINLTPIVLAEEQEDLTHLPFVTIDSENTRDMDDAVYLEATESGWHLKVAIADPTRFIAPGTPLDQEAQRRASTVYLLGQSITMLPTELSHDTFSLVPDQQRPALICTLHVGQDGSIGEFSFTEAMIRSHHKLNYQSVSEWLENPECSTVPAPVLAMLKELQAFAATRAQHRQDHALVMEDRADYYYILNDQKKIERIEKRERTPAHRIVEEAMLATNICAGKLLTQHPGLGIFSNHVGFRPERLEDALSLLEEDSPEYSVGDLQNLPDFQRLLQDLRLNPDGDESFTQLLPILQRMLQASALSLDSSEHFGLGFQHYATVTSPIRRYHDFHNHLAIKQILHGNLEPRIDPALVESLQQQLTKGRQACRQQEQWLACEYYRDKIGSVHLGTIGLVTSNGVGVRLDESGFEGFVMLASKDAPKPRFDARRLSLTLDDQRYQLDQKLMVVISEVDLEQRRISLELVDPQMAERLKAWHPET